MRKCIVSKEEPDIKRCLLLKLTHLRTEPMCAQDASVEPYICQCKISSKFCLVVVVFFLARLGLVVIFFTYMIVYINSTVEPLISDSFGTGPRSEHKKYA